MLEEACGCTADSALSVSLRGVLMTVSFLGSGTCGSRPVLALGPCLTVRPEGRELRPGAEGVFERTSRVRAAGAPVELQGIHL